LCDNLTQDDSPPTQSPLSSQDLQSSKLPNLLTYFRQGTNPRISDTALPLSIPREIDRRPRKFSMPKANSLKHAYTKINRWSGCQLHPAAASQIMSTRPQTKPLQYIDWCNVVSESVRLAPKLHQNPLNYTWPSEIINLTLADNNNIKELLHHAQNTHRCKGIFICTDISQSNYDRLKSFCWFSLCFQRNDKIFVAKSNPTRVVVLFSNDFSTKVPNHSSAQATIHKDWNDLVTFPPDVVNVSFFKKMLAYHPVDDFVFTALDAQTFGVSYEMSNLLAYHKPYLNPPSKRHDWEALKPLIATHLSKLYSSKPFPWKKGDSLLNLPVYNVITQPIFVTYKKLSKKPRKINDLSGKTAANAAQVYDYPKKWLGFKDIKKKLQFYGPGSRFRKDDLKDAFNIVKMHVQDIRVAGESIPFPGSNHPTLAAIILNLRTVFGGVRSYQMYDEAIGAPLHFVLMVLIEKALVPNYLTKDDFDFAFDMNRWSDDFISIVCGNEDFKPRTKICDIISNVIDDAFARANLQKTTVPFNNTMITLGHGLIADKMLSFLTEPRREYMLELVCQWIDDFHNNIPKILEEWQSMHGSLRFASQVIECAHIFVNPFSAIIGTMVSKNLKATRIGANVHVCNQWFKKVFSEESYCTRSLTVEYEWRHVEDMGLIFSRPAGDASFWGRGFVCEDTYLQAEWDVEMLVRARRDKTFDINLLEAYTIVDGINTNGEKFRGKSIICRSDSQTWVTAWEKGKAGPYLTVMLICLMDICLFYDIRLKIEHIEGTLNTDPDSISRNCLQAFLAKNPNAKRIFSTPWITNPTWPEYNSYQKMLLKKIQTLKASLHGEDGLTTAKMFQQIL
jgi:hypothetical protein